MKFLDQFGAAELWAKSKAYSSALASGKQDKLTAGDNITISGDTISATDTKPIIVKFNTTDMRSFTTDSKFADLYAAAKDGAQIVCILQAAGQNLAQLPLSIAVPDYIEWSGMVAASAFGFKPSFLRFSIDLHETIKYWFSSVDGYNTVATGSYSHAGGRGTIALGDSQTAIGQYNLANADSIFVIGKGANDTDRSNALEVDWFGNLKIAGKLNGVDVGELPKADTTYTLGLSGQTLTLTSSAGTAQLVTLPGASYDNATSSADGLMSKEDKSKLDSITVVSSDAYYTKAEVDAAIQSALKAAGVVK